MDNKKEYPEEVQARINVGWEVVTETDYSILLAAGEVRMNFDKVNRTFSQMYRATVLEK